MTTGELKNIKFNTTKKFRQANREKDKQFLKRIAIISSLGILAFIFGRGLKL